MLNVKQSEHLDHMQPTEIQTLRLKCKLHNERLYQNTTLNFSLDICLPQNGLENFCLPLNVAARKLLGPLVSVHRFVLFLFTVRRYALHGISYRNSVCLSVRHTRGLCPHGSTYDHDFFTTG